MKHHSVTIRLAARKRQSKSPRHFTAADAPPAARNQPLRRLWAAEANRVLRRTGNPDAALRAAAQIVAAALDCDALAVQVAREAGAGAPVTLPVSAERRGRNREGAGDRVAELILAGGQP